MTVVVSDATITLVSQAPDPATDGLLKQRNLLHPSFTNIQPNRGVVL